MTQATEIKETKAQKAERLKREKNPWEAFDEVRAFAREGRASVVPEWASTYFKWWGIYTQGDGVGATGGKGGEGLVSDYFMMRIGIPNGIVFASQLRVIGALTRKYARNLADITVRQNIQLHWLTIESLPEIVDALDAIGLSPKGACGDVVRNVTGCPPMSSLTPRRWPPRFRTCSRQTRSSTIFRANSRSPLPAAPLGALIRRSTISA
jgi:sulfite reductase (ferredoxin)